MAAAGQAFGLARAVPGIRFRLGSALPRAPLWRFSVNCASRNVCILLLFLTKCDTKLVTRVNVMLSDCPFNTRFNSWSTNFSVYEKHFASDEAATMTKSRKETILTIINDLRHWPLYKTWTNLIFNDDFLSIRTSTDRHTMKRTLFIRTLCQV